MNVLLAAALAEIGTTELKGGAHNPAILKYFHSIGHQWVTTDETAWCSAFANYIAKSTGHEYTGKLNARSWLDVGYKPLTPQPGDIVILWRESRNSWKGHVGFFVREHEGQVYIMGGNQSNQANIKPYPLSRLLGYRRLKLL